jgi:hypothetical protein
MRWKSGETYEGEWRDGNRNGFGRNRQETGTANIVGINKTRRQCLSSEDKLKMVTQRIYIYRLSNKCNKRYNEERSGS